MFRYTMQSLRTIGVSMTAAKQGGGSRTGGGGAGHTLEVGLLMGKMSGRSLQSAIAARTSWVNSLPAPARPMRVVGFACSA